MYNPHMDRAYDMVENICDKHPDSLVSIKLDWEEMVCSDGAAQLIPIVDVQFKF